LGWCDGVEVVHGSMSATAFLKNHKSVNGIRQQRCNIR
jgi:hypothetical protein